MSSHGEWRFHTHNAWRSSRTPMGKPCRPPESPTATAKQTGRGGPLPESRRRDFAGPSGHSTHLFRPVEAQTIQSPSPAAEKVVRNVLPATCSPPRFPAKAPVPPLDSGASRPAARSRIDTARIPHRPPMAGRWIAQSNTATSSDGRFDSTPTPTPLDEQFERKSDRARQSHTQMLFQILYV